MSNPPPPPAPLRETLPMATKLLYSSPSFAGAAMVIPISVHMTKFYSDSVLVPLGVLGIAIALARAFDAITDPLVGWLSDKTRTRFGRRRPWIFVGGPLCGIAFYFLFSPPASLDPAGGAAWFITWYLLYFLFHTVYIVPYVALGAELTLDYHDRSSLFGIREAFVVGGTLFAAVLPSALSAELGERQAFSLFAAIFGTLVGLLYMMLAVRVRERAEFSVRPPNPLVPGLRRSLRNRPFRLLLGIALFNGIPGALTGTLLPFFNQYVVRPENPSAWLTYTLGAYFGSAFFFLPIWMYVSRRFGKRRAMMLSQIIAATVSVLILAVGEGDTLLLVFLLIATGSTFGSLSFIIPSMKADVIDHDELHTGRRREAQYTSLWAILPKFVNIPAAAIPIAVLGTLGYVPNEPQSETVLTALRMMFGLTPAACFVAGLWMTWRFPIEATTHQQILEGIAAHGRGEPADDPVTGRRLPPPGGETVDDATAWYLDHFSTGELRLAEHGGQRILLRRVVLVGALALASSLAFGASVFGTLTDVDQKPGVGTVLAVVAAGLSLCAWIVHAVRYQAARGFDARRIPSETLALHRAGIDEPR